MRLKVMIGNTLFDSDSVAGLMDPELREELHSARDWTNEQEFVDAYCDAHRAKFDEEFVAI